MSPDRASATPDRPRPLVWPGYVHLWPLLATGVLIVNDHLLKPWPAAPTALTGKLSDFAGLFFFPLLVFALLDLSLRAAGQRDGGQRIHLGVVCMITALGFAAIQLVPQAAELYRGLGAATASVLSGVRDVEPTVTMDPVDLIALPMVWLAWRHAGRFFPTGR